MKQITMTLELTLEVPDDFPRYTEQNNDIEHGRPYPTLMYDPRWIEYEKNDCSEPMDLEGALDSRFVYYFADDEYHETRRVQVIDSSVTVAENGDAT